MKKLTLTLLGLFIFLTGCEILSSPPVLTQEYQNSQLKEFVKSLNGKTYEVTTLDGVITTNKIDLIVSKKKRATKPLTFGEYYFQVVRPILANIQTSNYIFCDAHFNIISVIDQDEITTDVIGTLVSTAGVGSDYRVIVGNPNKSVYDDDQITPSFVGCSILLDRPYTYQTAAGYTRTIKTISNLKQLGVNSNWADDLIRLANFMNVQGFPLDFLNQLKN